MSSAYIDYGTVGLGDDPLSPAKVLLETPEGIVAPSQLQIKRLDTIRSNLPSLWKNAMTELQRFFDENTDNRGCARDGIREVAVTIHEPGEDETDEDFFWNIALVVNEDVPEQYWEIHFNGQHFQRVVLYP